MARAARRSNSTLIELFLDMLASERGAAPNTLAAYARDLARFASFAQKRGCSLSAVERDDMDQQGG